MEEPEHPGDVLAWHIEKLNWNQAMFSEVIDRPAQFVSEVINGKTGITRESAAQFGAALGTTPQFWLNLQDEHQLWVLSQDKKVQKKLRHIKKVAEDYVNSTRLL